jgi:hypothetical protein
MLYETHFLFALSLTWLVEVPLLFLLVRYIARRSDISAARIIGTALLATALTLPYLLFVLPPYVDAAYYILIGELFVIVIEAVVFYLLLKVRPAAAVFLSLAVNVCSYAIGLWLG